MPDEPRLRQLFDAFPGAVMRARADGRVEYLNPGWVAVTGVPEVDAVERHLLDLFDPADRRGAGLLFADADGSRPATAELRLTSGRWVQCRAVAGRDARGAVTGWYVSLADITELVHQRERAARLAAVVESTNDLVGITDQDGRVVYLNHAARERFGYVGRDLRGVSTADLFAPSAFETYFHEIRPALLRGATWTGDLEMFDADANVIHVWQSIVGGVGPGGEIAWLSTIGRDVTQRKQWEAELHHRATHDVLTGLANRAHLLDHVSLALARAARSGEAVGLLFIDLDRFKEINDRHGHDTGDAVLREAAARITAALRPTDTVARLGGDEFVVLCDGVDGVRELTAVARRVYGMVAATPFTTGAARVALTASVGIALAMKGETGADALLARADTAMYRAKEHGRARIEVFDRALSNRTSARDSVAHDLAVGITQGAITVLYEPVIDLRSGGATGFEAVVGWHHPARGLLGAGELLPLAEERGLMVPLGLQVLRQACRQARRWELEHGSRAPRVHVNLAAGQLADPGLPGMVSEMLRETGLSAPRLYLEVPEPALTTYPDESRSVLEELKAIDVGLAVDGFGAGASSLRHLASLPIDVIKLAPALVAGIGATSPSEDAGSAVVAVARLAAGLQMRTIADGVTTAAQVTRLRGLGYDAAQGNAFARPQRAGPAGRLLTRRFCA